MLDATTRFPGLPPAFVSDLRTMVDDGTVSTREVALLAQHPALWRVAASTREEVLALVQLWAEEDGGGGSASAPAVAPAHA